MEQKNHGLTLKKHLQKKNENKEKVGKKHTKEKKQTVPRESPPRALKAPPNAH